MKKSEPQASIHAPQQVFELAFGARDLYNLAYGKSKQLILTSKERAVILTVHGDPLPTDEYDATAIVRRAKGGL